MNFDFGTIHAVWTVLLTVLFLGIVFWVYGRKRASDFEDAARLPLDDDSRSEGKNAEEKNHV